MGQSIQLLLSAMLDGNRNVVLKFYDPDSGKIKLVRDSSYEEYSYAEPSYHKLVEIDPGKQVQAEKTDPVTGEKLQLVKAYARAWSFGRHDVESGVDANGSAILETKKSNQVWESDIKLYESYLHDRDLSVGLFYDITGKPKKIDMPVPENVDSELRVILDSKESGKFKEYLKEWADSLSQPVPHLRRVAVDIEVDAQRDQTIEALINGGSNTITAVSFKGDGIDRVLVLDPSGETTDCGDFELHSYPDEPSMLRAAFKIIEEFPVILTYNGTNFDLPYMAARTNTLEACGGGRFDVPFEVRKTFGSSQATHVVSFRKCVHVDLYQIMDNRAFQVYVFDNKYSKKGLDDVSRAILGRGKIEYDVFAKHPVRDLAKYCYNDSLLTYDLTAHENDMLMNMLVIISRIARMPLDDVARYRVSQWVRSRLYYNHRRGNFLIPNRHDLEARSQGVISDAKIKGKKYQGGLVIEPHPGIYFDVMVVDFASLYPSIVKSYNISYETVRCPHAECRSNMLPLTNHWCCTKKYGITSLMIGSLRDLRVQYYKRLSKDDSIPNELRFQYSAVAQALKVILNASYGVMGAETFPLFFTPAAEAVTAIGRHITQGSIDICKEHGVRVLYSDTDSVFLLAPSDEQVGAIISEVRAKFKVDLEVDKAYKFCVFSDRKKNYYGMLTTGKMDVKGLVGKKSHTPQFVKELFSDVLRELAGITCRDDIKPILNRVIGMVRKSINDVRDGKIPLEAMAFITLLGTQLENYSVLLKPSDAGFIPGIAPGKHPLKNVFEPNAKCPLDARVYSRVPLHVKAALWTCSEPGDVNYTNTHEKAVDMLAGSGLKKGDGVSYIKMTDPVVALPLGMFGDASDAGAEWRVPERFRAKMELCEPEFGRRTCTVDIEKYVELVITTLGPLLEPLGMVLKSKHAAKPAKRVPVSKHAAKTDIKTASSLSFYMD